MQNLLQVAVPERVCITTIYNWDSGKGFDLKGMVTTFFSEWTLLLGWHRWRPIFVFYISILHVPPQVDFGDHCGHFLQEEQNTSDLLRKHDLKALF